ncbi:hypothetical protein L210DRAFT_844178 [Boletus edulis BED1]|uniref:Uncharacterized protein n=1 Tax=Boletus edulis BED1 TaxID=1328754 RepID=A0AAD4G6A2_BOLED|nr:hypothetical protein L210DRAFT_844178 [Boletus edulis BED1]
MRSEQDRTFAKTIQRVHIDEAHNIHTSGLLHHGEDAFRPVYGQLAEFRASLRQSSCLSTGDKRCS